MAGSTTGPAARVTRVSGTSQETILLWVYNLVGVPFLFLGFHLLKLFHPKIRRGIRGRRGLWIGLNQTASQWPADVPRIWLHAASMGELEQARPIVAALRQRIPRAVIVLTVFSPSAGEHVAEVPGADLVTYLPFDSYAAARRFVNRLCPDVVLFVRYDIWPNHLHQASIHGASTFLVDASVRRQAVFSNPILRTLNRSAIALFDQVAAISTEEARKLRRLSRDPDRVVALGDTRYDQVVARAYERRPQVEQIRQVLGSGWIVVAGSTWPDDEERLLPAFARLSAEQVEVRLVLVPHEPSAATLEAVRQGLGNFGLRWRLLSELGGSMDESIRVVVVDAVGILANLYALARVAFVGGGFGPGVHSVLEPAAHGVPVLFGPRFNNSPEAVQMAAEGWATRVASWEEIFQRLRSYRADEELRQRHGTLARQFIEARQGASGRIADLVVAALDAPAAVGRRQRPVGRHETA